MSEQRSNDPLHGMTLKAILAELVERYGWEELASRIRINCFSTNPDMKSSLTFLRKTPWARNKVEQLYLSSINGDLSKGTKPKSLKSKTPPAPAKPRGASAPAKPKINLWTGKPFEDGEGG